MTYNPKNEECPVCGYYCLGKGGFGCIDKPSLVNKEASPETKLIASQLRERALREALLLTQEGSEFFASLPEGWSLAAEKDYAQMKSTLSQPTDTAEADALLARVRELEGELSAVSYSYKLDEELIGKIQEVISVIANRPEVTAISHSDRGFTRLQDQLTAARAVIEEAERVLEQLATQTVEPRSASVASAALTRIREWKGVREMTAEKLQAS